MPNPWRRWNEPPSDVSIPFPDLGDGGVSEVLARAREWWLRRRRTFAPPDPAFAYRIGWMTEVRTWDAVRRAAMADELRPVLGAPDFVANAYDRRYRVPALDAGLHAGASLVALQQVLQAFELDPS
jgi:hypothetical protein